MNTQNIVGKIVYAKRVDDDSRPAAYICVGQDRGITRLVPADLSIDAAFIKPVWLSVSGNAGWKIVGVVHDPAWIEEIVEYLEELFHGDGAEWDADTLASAEKTIRLLRDLIVPDGAHASTEWEPDPETVKASMEAYAAGRCRPLREFIDEIRAEIRAEIRDEVRAEPDPQMVDDSRGAVERGDFVTAEEFIAVRHGNKLRREAKAKFSTKPVTPHTSLGIAYKEYMDRLLAFRDAAAKYREALDAEYCDAESLRIRKVFGWA